MITLKAGVDAKGLTPQIVLAIAVANSVWCGEPCVVTSLNDGVHGGKPVMHTDKDPHYLGLAVDLRTAGLTSPRYSRDRLAAALGNQYVVLLESNHIHVQWGHIA